MYDIDWWAFEQVSQVCPALAACGECAEGERCQQRGTKRVRGIGRRRAEWGALARWREEEREGERRCGEARMDWRRHDERDA